MLVHEIMTPRPVSIGPEAAVGHALKKLAVTDVSTLPVVDASGRVVGVLSEGDVLLDRVHHDARAHLRRVTDPRPGDERVARLMTADPTTVQENDDVADVAAILVRSHWRSLPVVRDGHLVGIISRSDVIRALDQSDPRLREEVLASFRRFGHPDWTVAVTHGTVTVTGPSTPHEIDLAEGLAGMVAGVRFVSVTDDAGAAV